MREPNRRQFADGMLGLRNCYGAFFGEPAEWTTRLSTYFDQLRDFDIDDVLAALKLAPEPDYHPERFPTSGQLKRLAVLARIEREKTAGERAKQAQALSEDERAREDFALVPTDPEAQAIYIGEALSPYEQLGRTWQCESKNLGLDPTKPIPSEMAARRMRELDAMFTALADVGMRTEVRHQRASNFPTAPRDESKPPAPPAPTQETAA